MSEKNYRESGSGDSPTSTPLVTRRAVLTAAGTVSLGSLAGCAALDRLSDPGSSEAVGPTSAAPAAAFAGALADGPYPSRHSNTYRLAPVIRADAGPLSGDVELEGWVTTQVTTENYNSPRSNRSIARLDDEDSDGDGVPDEVESGVTALELEAQVQDAADRAVASISKRSARTGRNPETGKEITAALDDMNGTVSELRSVLERCSDESCVAALASVGRVEAAVQNARVHVENEEWDAAIRAIDGVGNDILIGDYVIATENRPPNGEERAALGKYLTGSPMVGERFTVCLPDAEVPGGNGNLAEGVTPQRFIDYMTGRAADSEGELYAWGSNIRSAAGETDDDEDDGTACSDTASAGSGNELVCRARHLEADISGPTSTAGSLDYTRLSDGTITVVNTPPRAEPGVSTLVCPVEGDAYEPSELSEWGSESGPSAETPTVVCQVLVQPPECPVPVPAMLYLKRCRKHQQLVYAGGWILDTAALHRESATVLTIAGETQVVGVDVIVDDECCFDYNDAVSRLLSSDLARRGARVSGGPTDSLVVYGVLPGAAVDGLNTTHSGPPGRVFVTHTALDAPIVHLINARTVSDAVKFKAGAELSKSVN